MAKQERAMLKVENLARYFGGIKAVDGIDFDIHRGEILGLIGPNGSGKSTTVNLIAGLYAPTTGRVTYEGQDIQGLPTQCVAKLVGCACSARNRLVRFEGALVFNCFSRQVRN
jgi:ABC-type branched-subunit amino acid transport system ATPase component